VKLARSHLRWKYRYPVMCKSEIRLSSRTTCTPVDGYPNPLKTAA
jgi:hypothetical protein